jgi:hypothetical protein
MKGSFCPSAKLIFYSTIHTISRKLSTIREVDVSVVHRITSSTSQAQLIFFTHSTKLSLETKTLNLNISFSPICKLLTLYA